MTSCASAWNYQHGQPKTDRRRILAACSYQFANIIGIISLRLAERDVRVRAWQENERSLGSAPPC